MLMRFAALTFWVKVPSVRALMSSAVAKTDSCQFFRYFFEGRLTGESAVSGLLRPELVACSPSEDTRDWCTLAWAYLSASAGTALSSCFSMPP